MMTALSGLRASITNSRAISVQCLLLKRDSCESLSQQDSSEKNCIVDYYFEVMCNEVMCGEQKQRVNKTDEVCYSCLVCFIVYELLTDTTGCQRRGF